MAALQKLSELHHVVQWRAQVVRCNCRKLRQVVVRPAQFLNHLLRLRLSFGERTLNVPPFRDIAKYQNSAGDLSIFAAYWRGAVVHRQDAPILADEYRMIGKAHNLANAKGMPDGIFNRFPVIFALQYQDLFDWFSPGFVFFPPAEALGFRVHETDTALAVSGNHAVSNAGERSSKKIPRRQKISLVCPAFACIEYGESVQDRSARCVSLLSRIDEGRQNTAISANNIQRDFIHRRLNPQEQVEVGFKIDSP